MASYTTVDEVCARFPKFKRSGPVQILAPASAARTSNVATFTTAAAHGFAVGWLVVVAGITAAGATNFDGTFQVLGVPSATAFTVQQIAADDTGTGGTVSGAAPGAISDGQVQNWVDERADYIEAEAQSRGYVLSQLPPATAADANTILGNLNKLAAQVLLGEAIQSQMGIVTEWKLLADIRAESADLLKCFRQGNFDKLFGTAKTQDVGPQLGGYAPGAPLEADNRYSITPPRGGSIFRKDEQL